MSIIFFSFFKRAFSNCFLSLSRCSAASRSHDHQMSGVPSTKVKDIAQEEKQPIRFVQSHDVNITRRQRHTFFSKIDVRSAARLFAGSVEGLSANASR